MEFMEFYRLKYSVSVFGPEANLDGKPQDKSALAKKVGVQVDENKPVLMQMFEALTNGGGASAARPADDSQPIQTSLNQQKLASAQHSQPAQNPSI